MAAAAAPAETFVPTSAGCLTPPIQEEYRWFGGMVNLTVCRPKIRADHKPLVFTHCPSINGLFVQSLRYAQKIILGILNICLWLFFSHALILNKNPNFWMDTT